MFRVVGTIFGVLLCVCLGAQVMLWLEGGDGAVLTLGQCAALFYLPDPVAASTAIGAIMQDSAIIGGILAMPALTVLFALWLISWAAGRFRRRR